MDLLEHHDMAGASLDDLEHQLSRALAAGRFALGTLRAMTRGYGTRATQALVERAAGHVGENMGR